MQYKGWPLLWAAAEHDLGKVVKVLVDKKADINAQNRSGRSALSFAAAPSKCGTPQPKGFAVLALLRAKADATLASRSSQTPKQMAETREYHEVLIAFAEYDKGDAIEV